VTDASPDLPPMRPPSWRYRIVVTAALVVAAIALYAGIRATETDDGSAVSRPDIVEQIIPRRGSEALQQAEVGIDLASGYEGALILNGTPIPTAELRLVPEQNQVFFAPAPDRTFEVLPSGQNCVTAVVWRSEDGPGTADLRIDWCFDVT
jgi:hypothetical protein